MRSPNFRRPPAGSLGGRLVVADTTPLNYLVLTSTIDVLSKLYSRILIPLAVLNELTHEMTPDPVRAWFKAPPKWLEIIAVKATDPALDYLDSGEREAIALAREQQADLLLMDDREGVRAARTLGLVVTGTLGVLDRAAEHGLIDLRAVFLRLQQTTFRMPPEIAETLLANDAKRKKN